MLFENLGKLAYENDIRKVKPEDYSYITENLKHSLYEWQKEALENFLLNERIRTAEKNITPNHLMFNMATGSGKTLVMAALILYYYKEKGITNFIFFVNQNTIVGKTQDNFINKGHSKYLYKDNIVIDGKRVSIKEVEQFSNSTDTIQIKFTTIQKLHNDIYKENENSLLLSDLRKRNLVLIGDEAHHLNATTSKKSQQNMLDENNISFIGELKDSSKDEDVERSWETTVCHHILYKGKKGADSQNKNVLLEFTATVPETEEVQNKYEDKIIIKFDLKEFINAGCTKHIRLVRSNLSKDERILQALVMNWYRFQIALKNNIPNFKPVILFRSKTIEESKQDYTDFIEMCKNIKASDFSFLSAYAKNIETGDEVPEAYSADKDIFAKIISYMKDNGITNSKLEDYVRENFQERNCIITNSATNKSKTEKTDSEIDKMLNCLEDVHNHIGAIFTVQRLTEGWDVLNLFDIVRLYTGRDTDYKKKEVGKGTTSEVQLIGRGVRYYPFKYENKAKDRRKFDNDVSNELRVLEEFYFHSDNDSKYISDLSLALKKSNLIHSTLEEKKFSVKKEFRDDFSKMYLLCNQRKDNPDRKLKTLPKDFVKLRFYYNFETKFSQITDVNINSDDETTDVITKSNSCNSDTFTILDIPSHIVHKSIHKLNSDSSSYFSFENISKRFKVKSMNEFIDFIKSIPMELTFSGNNNLETTENSDILEMTESFLFYCQSELEKYDHPFAATEFELVPFESCFKFETTRMIDTANSDYDVNNQFEKKCRHLEWYALDSFWGTSEERNLVNYIINHFTKLEEVYDNIVLLRNEEVYKIFDFDTGEGFQPDFLLLLRGKEGKKNAYFQVFIEPKGKHLAGDDNDGWKEKLLLKISERYGLAKPFVKKSNEYVLFGLPFFNEADNDMKNKFENEFYKTLDLTKDSSLLKDLSSRYLEVADKH